MPDLSGSMGGYRRERGPFSGSNVLGGGSGGGGGMRDIARMVRGAAAYSSPMMMATQTPMAVDFMGHLRSKSRFATPPQMPAPSTAARRTAAPVTRTVARASADPLASAPIVTGKYMNPPGVGNTRRPAAPSPPALLAAPVPDMAAPQDYLDVGSAVRSRLARPVSPTKPPMRQAAPPVPARAPAPAAAPTAPTGTTQQQYRPLPTYLPNGEYMNALRRYDSTAGKAPEPIARTGVSNGKSVVLEGDIYDPSAPENAGNIFGPRAPGVDETMAQRMQPRRSASPMQAGMPDIDDGFRYADSYVDPRVPNATERYVRERTPDGSFKVTGATMFGPNVSREAMIEANRGAPMISSGTPQAAERRRARREDNQLNMDYRDRLAQRRQDALDIRREANALRQNQNMPLAAAARQVRQEREAQAARDAMVAESARRYDDMSARDMLRIENDAARVANEDAASQRLLDAALANTRMQGRGNRLRARSSRQALDDARLARAERSRDAATQRAFDLQLQQMKLQNDLAMAQQGYVETRSPEQIEADQLELASARYNQQLQQQANQPFRPGSQQTVAQHAEQYNKLRENVANIVNPSVSPATNKVNQALMIIRAPETMATYEEKMEMLSELGIDQNEMQVLLEQSDLADGFFSYETVAEQNRYNNAQTQIDRFFNRKR